jgi:hypothetical protein
MAGDDEGASFVARLSDTFHRSLFQPMFQRAPVAPGDVRQLIAECRRKLELLDEVIATAEAGGAKRTMTTVPGVAQRSDLCDEDASDLDEIGRNQRSRVRELALLEAMAREPRPYSLQQLLSSLAQKGFSDSSAAVVSQLHRLKKLGLINQPASGMYEITTDGLGHQRKLRSSFGGLVSEAR